MYVYSQADINGTSDVRRDEKSNEKPNEQQNPVPDAAANVCSVKTIYSVIYKKTDPESDRLTLKR